MSAKHDSSSKNFLRNYLWSTATKELAVEVRAKMEVSKRGLMQAPLFETQDHSCAYRPDCETQFWLQLSIL